MAWDAPVKPLPPVSIHFLGTCSGGGPIASRNCSSLAVDFGNDIWLFDAADGTLGRLHQSPLKMGNISRIFITHMHADHVLGLVSILTTIMSGVSMTEAGLQKLKEDGLKKKADVNIYGPVGLRQLVRTSLNLTSVTLAGAFAVHEIVPPAFVPSGRCNIEDLHINEAVGTDLLADDRNVWEGILTEGKGRCAKGWAVDAGPIEHRIPSLGYVLREPTPRTPLDTATIIPLLQSNASALAALDPPIKHPLSLLSHLASLPPPPPYTLPSGEILYPPSPSGISPRKIVIFGDCSGGTRNERFRQLCEDPSLLVHECTNGAIPERLQRGTKGMKFRRGDLEHSLVKRQEKQGGGTPGAEADGGDPSMTTCPSDTTSQDGEAIARQAREIAKKAEVQRKALSRGHSTPDEVGEFARAVRARRLVVNHFSAMFPSPRYPTSQAFPSLLLPISPFPLPTPLPLGYFTDPVLQPHPLTGAELHLRLILNSLTDQISQIWNDPSDSFRKMAVPARDFMVVPIPAHEITGGEAEEMKRFEDEARWVTTEWELTGRIWVGEEGSRRWIGVETPGTT